MRQKAGAYAHQKASVKHARASHKPRGGQARAKDKKENDEGGTRIQSSNERRGAAHLVESAVAIAADESLSTTETLDGVESATAARFEMGEAGTTARQRHGNGTSEELEEEGREPRKSRGTRAR